MGRTLLLFAAALTIAGLVVAVALDRSDAAGSDGTIAYPDTSGSVGRTSLVLDAAGNPVVAYHVDNPFRDLRVLHCGNPSCTSGNSVEVPDGYTHVGYGASLVLDAAGYPVVTYSDQLNNTLRVLHCGDANCSAGNSIVDIPTRVSSSATTLKLDAAGNPVVAYLVDDAVNGTGLAVLHCGTPTCSSGYSLTVVTPDIASQASMQLDGNGFPAITYTATTHLKLLRCGNANCTAGNVFTTLDSDAFINSMQLNGDNPVIAYEAYLGSPDLRVIKCTNPTCTTGNTPVVVDTPGAFDPAPSMVLDSTGRPVIAYKLDGSDDLALMHCGNLACTFGNSYNVPDTEGSAGWDASLQLDAAGNPVVSYAIRPLSGIRVLHCGNPACSGTKATPTPCPTDGCTTPTPLFPTPTVVPDTDNDGCDDREELGFVPLKGGHRDPANAYDFYDIAEGFNDGNPDGIVTFFGDIFTVAFQFGEEIGDPTYDAALDRSPPPSAAEEPDPAKREVWDMGPPDGLIDLFVDIFGVAYQFGHDCSEP